MNRWRKKLGDGISYSQHKLVRRIFLFETKTYREFSDVRQRQNQ
jgi:hypothetical protein